MRIMYFIPKKLCVVERRDRKRIFHVWQVLRALSQDLSTIRHRRAFQRTVCSL